jgi:hypothetical protein
VERAAAFCFLRRANQPIAPRPVAKSGKAAGSGTGTLIAVFNNDCTEFLGEWSIEGKNKTHSWDGKRQQEDSCGSVVGVKLGL